MRVVQTQFTVFLLFASFGVFFCGCGGDSTVPQGPEMGTVQKYLDEHPEAREDAAEGTASEEEEFDAAGTDG